MKKEYFTTEEDVEICPDCWGAQITVSMPLGMFRLLNRARARYDFSWAEVLTNGLMSIDLITEEAKQDGINNLEWVHGLNIPCVGHGLRGDY